MSKLPYFLNITEVKAKLSAMIGKVRKGQEIVITVHGEPVAKIISYEAPKKRSLIGLFDGQFKVPDDFDEWPEDEARALGIID